MTQRDDLQRELLDLIADLPIEEAQKTTYQQTVHQGGTLQFFEEIGTLIKTKYTEASTALSTIEARIDAALQAEERQRQAEFERHQAQLENEAVLLKEIETQVTQEMDIAELEVVRRQLQE